MSDHITYLAPKFQEHRDYWTSLIPSFQEGFHLETNPQEAEKERRIYSFEYRLSDGALNRLNSGKAMEGFITLCAALVLVLRKVSGKENITFHTPHLQGFNGEFSREDSVPMNLMVEDKMTFDDLQSATKEAMKAAYQYGIYPTNLIEYKEGELPFSSNILVSAAAIHQSLDTKVDLHVHWQKTENNILIHFDQRSFDEVSLRTLLDQIDLVLNRDENGEHIASIDWLHQNDRSLVTTTVVESLPLTWELISKHIHQHPDRIALTLGNEAVTYGKLDEYTRQLGSYCQQEIGNIKGLPIGLFMNRSIDALLHMLGMLRFGAVYVPIDPKTPEIRLQEMIETAGIRHILTDQDMNVNGVNNYRTHWNDLHELVPAEQLPKLVSDDLAYILFTSGSTGKPKAVKVEHGNLSSLIFGLKSLQNLTDSDDYIVSASFSFDASIKQLLAPLTIGATTHLLEDVSDMHQLAELIEHQCPACLHLSPAVWSALLNVKEEQGHKFSSLTKVSSGGDHMTANIRTLLRRNFPMASIWNIYGPTETCINVTGQLLQNEDSNPYVIGEPFSGVTVKVLNREGSYLPKGMWGELVISGPFVTAGYLNSPGEDDSFYEKEGIRHYRTGDWARVGAEGAIELKGRMDRQLQVRGIRIEPVEIESAMLQLDAVTQAVVDISDSENELLLGVYQPNSLDPEIMKAHLEKILPGTMIPDQLIAVPELPVNAAGKIDLKAVRDLQMNSRGTENALNELEFRIAKIWCKLLDVEFVNLSDDFFRIGGHSLAAMRMLFQLKVQLGVEITLKEFYHHATLLSFSQLVATKLKATGLDSDSVESFEDQDHYPVSHAQNRLWKLHQIDPKSLPAYNMAQCYRLQGDLDVAQFNTALRQLVDRHHGLMTRFVEIDEEVRQKIALNVSFSLDFQDLTGKSQAEMIWKDAADELNDYEFDLSAGPLFKGILFRISEEEYILIFAISHIISDGWSTGVIVSDLKSLYGQVELESLTVQSKDFAIAGSQVKGASDTERFWLDQYKKPFEALELPTIKSRATNRTYEGGIISVYLSEEIRRKFLEKSTSLNSSLFITFLGMVQAFISRWTTSDDIITGVPFSGRINAELQNQVGCYVNMLAVRTQIELDRALDDILKSAIVTSTQAFENGTYPFDELLSNLSVPVNPGRSPLFDIVVFQEENKDNRMEKLSSEIVFTEVPIDFGVSKYDLTISLKDGQNGLTVDFNYNREILEETVVERLTKGFEAFVTTGLKYSHLPLKEISILGDQEQQLIQQFSQGEKYPPTEATMDELFQSVVENHPDRVAIADGDLQLTYSYLDRYSATLSAILENGYNTKKGDRVAIVSRTKISYILGMLASARLGAMYVPLDATWPEDRIKSVLSDCQPAVVLSDHTENDWDQPTLNVLDRSVFGEEVNEKRTNNENEDPLYIIFTSGTTGKPKGVVVGHAGMVNLCKWHERTFTLNKGTIATQYASPGFDAMGWETWPYLTTGGRIEVVPESLKLDLSGLMRFYDQREVTHTFLPTAIYEQLDTTEFPELVRRLVVLTGGDKLRSINAGLPRAYNCYGPTEYSVVTSFDSIGPKSDQITIGRPIGNTSIYILNNRGQQQPIKTPGELCVGGEGLALGYWQDEAKTALKFRTNGALSQRLYHTGDIAYWDENGCIVYLHRDDTQIQIRGFRVEIGEIEQQLLKVNRVTQCAVIAEEKEEGWSLRAFYTAMTDTDTNEIRMEMERVLPYYMIPATFRQLEQMPLNASGKIDRKILLEMGNSEEYDQSSPATEEEEELLSIWTKILPTKNLGIHSNFFEAGGDSIKAIQLAAKSKEIGYRIKVSDIYSHPTVAGLLQNCSKNANNSVKAAQLTSAGLTPIQAWFYQRPKEARQHFNQCVMFFDQNRQEVGDLSAMLQVLVEHHDALKLHYPLSDPQEQKILSEGPYFNLQVHDCLTLSPKEIEQLATSCQNNFDITRGPLLRLDVLRAAKGDHLLFTLHHLIVDGVSWRILMEDLATLFDQHRRSQPLQLNATSDGFLNWSQTLSNWAKTPEALKDLGYWKSVGALVDQYNPFPSEGNYEQRNRGYHQITFTEEETSLLLGEANKAYQTQLEDFLLTALSLTLKSTLNAEKVPVLLESHGRHELFETIDINRTVGWFTSTYPVVLTPDPNSEETTLIATKEELRRIPEEGIGYGVLKNLVPLEKLGGVNLGSSPVIAFNYLGQFDEDLDEAGLSLSELDPGPTIGDQFPHDQCLTFTANVVDKKLQMTISYDQKMVNAALIENIANTYMQFVRRLLEHCVNQDTIQYTPSDFEASDLDFEDLNSITEIFES